MPPSFSPSCTMKSKPAIVTGTTEIACSTIAAPTAVSLSAPKNPVAPIEALAVMAVVEAAFLSAKTGATTALALTDRERDAAARALSSATVQI